MISTEPLVSVIVPTYNSEKFILKTLTSAANQSYRNIEIIVIDDFSKDTTYNTVSKFIESDSRFKLVQTEKQSNLPGVARNLGIMHAKGEFIAFLDHDDLWLRSKLTTQINYLVSNTNVGVVFSPLWQFSKRNKLLGLFMLRPPVGNLNRTSLLTGNPIQCSSVVVRSQVLKEVGSFSVDPKLRAVEDYELWLRISRDYEIHEIYKVLGAYYFQKISTSGTENMKQRLNDLALLHSDLQLSNESTLIQKIKMRFSFYPKILNGLLKNYLRLN